MSNVKAYTDSEILNRVVGLGNFFAFPSNPLDVWIRSAEDGYDQFDDKVYTFDCFGAGKIPKFVMVCSGTSNAGSYGLLNFRKYNSKGCAVLKSDEIVYNSHVHGLHKGKEAYVESRSNPFPYYRDSNGDRKANESGQIYYDWIAANCHRAGFFSSVIYNWSVACLVRNRLSEFMAWLSFMNRRPLTVAILKEW